MRRSALRESVFRADHRHSSRPVTRGRPRDRGIAADRRYAGFAGKACAMRWGVTLIGALLALVIALLIVLPLQRSITPSARAS